MSRGRYFSRRDVRMMNSLNGELLSSIIEQTVVIYRIDAESTQENMYGESLNKFYFDGIEIQCLVENDPESTVYEGFGPDVKKGTVFKFHQKLCEIKDIYPQIGDIVAWENAYFEIENVVENQFLGGQPEKNYSLLCNAHISRNSKINLRERNI
jgi:hypothetical protein|tara:strand:- start:1092 stop:1553 length:462 start_codon:yes stop_codon:yes gene_type:complete